MQLPTSTQLKAAFTAWFNRLVTVRVLVPTQVPQPGTTDAPPLTFAQIQALLATGGLPTGARIYQAQISQTGTDAPTASVLQNTLGGELVLAYIAPGEYSATLPGAFPPFGTLLVPGPTSFDSFTSVEFDRVSDDALSIITYDITDPTAPDAVDGILTKVFFQVIVWNP